MKILVVDDTEINIEILNELLGEHYDVLSALDGEFAIETAIEDQPDLILLDIMMPDMDGFETCRRLQANETTKNIPILFITAKTDDESIEEAYEIGGADYISKPFRPKELLAKVKRELKLQTLIKNLEETKNELKLLASIDPMTKLYNRRHFSMSCVHILGKAKRENTDLSLFMLDIDKFKNINDTYGHGIGDEVIILLANTLKNLTRDSDIVCRWGGEEFIVMLPNTNNDGAILLANKIREEVEGLIVSVDNTNTITFTVSIGVSLHNHDNNIEYTIGKSDEALYIAKEGGRNKVEFLN